MILLRPNPSMNLTSLLSRVRWPVLPELRSGWEWSLAKPLGRLSTSLCAGDAAREVGMVDRCGGWAGVAAS